MMAALVELSGGWRLITAVLAGFCLGFTLIKSGVCDPKRLRGWLHWQDARLWQTLAFATFLAALLNCYLNSRHALSSAAGGSSVTYPALLAGGLLCGIGMITAGATPLTALASLASGRLQALWFFCGGAAAVWLMSYAGDPLNEALSRFGGNVRAVRLPRTFWDLENPLLWVAGITLVITVIASILAGRRAR